MARNAKMFLRALLSLTASALIQLRIFKIRELVCERETFGVKFFLIVVADK